MNGDKKEALRVFQEAANICRKGLYDYAANAELKALGVPR